MDTKEKRAAFRKRLGDLSGKELVQWAFLCNLAQKIHTELCCFTAMFGEEDDLPPADPQLAGIQLAIQMELKRRSTTTKRQTKEGDHVNGNTNSTH